MRLRIRTSMVVLLFAALIAAGAALPGLLQRAQAQPASIDLRAGGNNVVYLGEELPVAAALGSAGVSVDAVWRFDAESQGWLLWNPALPASLQGFTALQTGRAYWVVSSATVTWPVTRAAGSLPESAQIRSGLTNVGYLGQTLPVVTALGDLSEAVSVIWSFSAASQQWLLWSSGLPASLQGFTELENGQAYWIVSSSNTTWTFPPPDGGAPAAVTVSLTASKDTTLYAESGDLGNGSGDYLFAGLNRRGEARRALLAFDVAASVPAGSTITSVRLQLEMTRTASGPATVSLHRTVSDWGEGAANAGGEEGGGGPAQPGDATWTHRFFATQLWSSAGGDFAANASASLPVGALGAYTWGSTEQLVSDVQLWLDDPSANFGWSIIGDENAAGASSKRFGSRSAAAESSRPVLIVEYVPVSP